MGGVTFQIRLARPEEYAAIGAVTVDAYAGDGLLHDESDYVKELQDAARRAELAELWVAVDEQGQVLGSVTYCPPGSPYRELSRDGEGEFRMLAVAPAARGRGVGEALVRHCEERAATAGASRMWLSTLDEMTHAQRIYARLGYRHEPARDWDPVPDLLPHVHLRAWTRELS